MQLNVKSIFTLVTLMCKFAQAQELDTSFLNLRDYFHEQCELHGGMTQKYQSVYLLYVQKNDKYGLFCSSVFTLATVTNHLIVHLLLVSCNEVGL